MGAPAVLSTLGVGGEDPQKTLPRGCSVRAVSQPKPLRILQPRPASVGLPGQSRDGDGAGPAALSLAWKPNPQSLRGCSGCFHHKTRLV